MQEVINIKDTIIAAIIGAVVGGSGIIGLGFIYLRRAIDSKLAQRTAADAKQRERHVRRLTIEDVWKHALGRLLFFMYKAITTGEHNGDLKEAWAKFTSAEDDLKNLDREIVVESETK